MNYISPPYLRQYYCHFSFSPRIKEWVKKEKEKVQNVLNCESRFKVNLILKAMFLSNSFKYLFKNFISIKPTEFK